MPFYGQRDFLFPEDVLEIVAFLPNVMIDLIPPQTYASFRKMKRKFKRIWAVGQNGA